jgi:hypothetical protein
MVRLARDGERRRQRARGAAKLAASAAPHLAAPRREQLLGRRRRAPQRCVRASSAWRRRDNSRKSQLLLLARVRAAVRAGLMIVSASCCHGVNAAQLSTAARFRARACAGCRTATRQRRATAAMTRRAAGEAP